MSHNKLLFNLVYIWATITGAKIALTNAGKISNELLAKLEAGQKPDIIVECSDAKSQSSADSQSTSLFDSPNSAVSGILQELHAHSTTRSSGKDQVVTSLVNRLQDHMSQDMQSSMDLLTSKGIQYEMLWSTGELFVTGANKDTVLELEKVKDVKRIRSVGSFKRLDLQETEGASTLSEEGSTWNLNLIRARCKNITCFGDNVTIGFIDTGARTTHHEIHANWHNSPFNWMDGTHQPPNCTAQDFDGHGTHVVGTACGVKVGVAPHANWIMCMGCTSANCSEAAVKICGQWILCPWRCGDPTPTKNSKNCSFRPHVVSNSWGMTNFEQLVMPYDFFYRILELWNAVGIISTFAIGNEGPACTSGIPPGSYDNALSVGAVDELINLSWFSSVGPQLSKKWLTNTSLSSGTCHRYCDNHGKNQVACKIGKPDIVAPGWKVNSCFNRNDTDFKELKGTSMATPHVAGVVALVLCANPGYPWNYKSIYKLLTETASRQEISLNGRGNGSRFGEDTNLMCNLVLGGSGSGDSCGGNYYKGGGGAWPNNMYGWGLTNACNAVSTAKLMTA